MSLVQHVVARIKAKPQNIFWSFAITHLVLWTLIPSLFSPNLPLDVIEGYAWGKEWVLGTHKHPPMQAWILEILFTVTDHAKWAPYLASQVAIVTAFWAVWQTGRRIAGESIGLLGALVLEGIIYYNFTSPEFNPNVLQIPFWALAGWSFHKAVKDNKIQDWLLLGLWSAGGMYSKYSSGLFLLMLGAAMLAHRDGRKRLKCIGPYLAVATGVLLFLPHFMWLVHHDFIPLEYTQGRFERHPKNYSTALTTTVMVEGQLIALLFAMFLLLGLYDRRHAPNSKPAPSFDRIFLTFAAFGPFAAMFCMSLVFGFHILDMWETPFWNFFGLWAIVFMRPALMPQDVRRFAMTWAVIFCAGLLIFTANETLSPYVMSKPKRTIFPGKHLAEMIGDTWHRRFNTTLNYVIGDTWPAGNVAWYLPDRPHVYMDGLPIINPSIDFNALKHDGGVIVWCIHCGERTVDDAMPAPLTAEFPEAEVQPPVTLKRMTAADIPPVVIGWALVPPKAAK
jgi:4-amino-4-deoxy-L-arabinose transferase-like glycosyltransferase